MEIERHPVFDAIWPPFVANGKGLTDPYSTGCVFTGWKAFDGRHIMWNVPEGYGPLIVWLPQTWLLREGWKRYGAIGFREVPGAARVR